MSKISVRHLYCDIPKNHVADDYLFESEGKPLPLRETAIESGTEIFGMFGETLLVDAVGLLC